MGVPSRLLPHVQLVAKVPQVRVPPQVLPGQVEVQVRVAELQLKLPAALHWLLAVQLVGQLWLLPVHR